MAEMSKVTVKQNVNRQGRTSFAFRGKHRKKHLKHNVLLRLSGVPCHSYIFTCINGHLWRRVAVPINGIDCRRQVAACCNMLVLMALFTYANAIAAYHG